MMKEFEKRNCRTIFRITCVKGLNLENAEEFSKLIKLAQPMFVELKGYAWLGESRKRLTNKNVPSLEDLMKFGGKI